MRSDAILAAAAALHFAIAPAPGAAATTVWLHVCGSDAQVPLKLPAGKDSDRSAPCHGASVLTAEKKKPRTR